MDSVVQECEAVVWMSSCVMSREERNIAPGIVARVKIELVQLFRNRFWRGQFYELKI